MEPEFADLGRLCSFVTNATTLVEATDLTPAGFSVLASLLDSGAEVEHLALHGGFAAFGNEFSQDLVSAIKQHSSVRSLALNAHEDWLAQVTITKEELYQNLAESMGAQLERLEIRYADFSTEDSVLLQAGFARCTAITRVRLFDCIFEPPKEFASDTISLSYSPSNRLTCLIPG